MRWFRIRKANIDSDLRNAFEQYGPNVMQLNLALGHYIKYNDKEILMKDVATPLSLWLTEQYDKDERKTDLEPHDGVCNRHFGCR